MTEVTGILGLIDKMGQFAVPSNTLSNLTQNKTTSSLDVVP